MNRIISLFLFIFIASCLNAQYNSPIKNKVTLGKQTTADGLVFRGVANDTDVITPFSDTSAYIILDTVNSKFYHYNRTTTFWSLAGGGVSVSSFSAGTTGLTPSTATTGAVTLGGTLAVANGGTGKSALTANKVLVGNGTDTIISPTNLHWRRYSADAEGLGIGTGANTDPAGSTRHHLSIMGGNYVGAYGLLQLMSPSVDAENQAYGILAFVDQSLSNIAAWMISRRGPVTYSGNYEFATSPGTSATNIIRRMQIRHDGKIGIGLIDATEILDVDGNARIRGLANGANPVNVQVDVNGVLVRTSSIDIKENVQSLPYGLNEVMLLHPSKFSYIDKYKYGEGYDIGFIAQDVNDVIPEAVGTGIESDIFMDSVKLIPVLTKAIQEQNALIKALEERILILENK